MTTNKKILERLDLIEKNFKKEIDSLRIDNETRFSELDKRTKLQEDISDLKFKLKDNDSIIEKYANKINELESENKNLKKENEDLKSDKYKSRTIRATKSKSQEMNLKTRMQGVAVSKIQKEVSENNLKVGKENV